MIEISALCANTGMQIADPSPFVDSGLHNVPVSPE